MDTSIGWDSQVFRLLIATQNKISGRDRARKEKKEKFFKKKFLIVCRPTLIEHVNKTRTM
ncbi:hypothetical protein DSUL_90010 [Desulfovibrionales bacterium]